MNIFMSSTQGVDSIINACRFQLVLPAYNEEKSLSKLIHEYSHAAQICGFSEGQFQLVIVENGSTDCSARVLSELKSTALGKWFSIVFIQQNKGYGHGLWTGLQETTAEVVGYSHADEQCAPVDVFTAYKKLQDLRDKKRLVKGVRFGRNWKDQGVTLVFEWMAKQILNLSVRELNAQPKVFDRVLLESIKNPPAGFAFDLYVLYQAVKQGFCMQTISVEFPPRVHGTSKWAATFFSRYKTILGMISYMRFLAKTEGVLGD